MKRLGNTRVRNAQRDNANDVSVEHSCERGPAGLKDDGWQVFVRTLTGNLIVVPNSL